MQTEDYKELCKQICLRTMDIGDYLQRQRLACSTMNIEEKGVHDYVTNFDKEAEQQLVAHLRQLLPHAGFIAEEGSAGRCSDEQYTWIIDPIDGTTNFIHSLPPTCISIALNEGSTTLIGVVYELWAKECFYAYLGGGAFLNGHPIHVSTTQNLDQSLIATGFPYTNFSRIEPYMQLLEWSMKHTHGLRRMGSAAADLVYTACGRFDGFFEYGLKPYDVAAGAFILQQAGGAVCDFSGGNNWLFGQEIVASNGSIHDTLTETVKRFLQ